MPLDDKIAGKLDQATGSVKETVGKHTGNESLEAEGQGEQVKGKGKEALGDVKDAVAKGKEALTGN